MIDIIEINGVKITEESIKSREIEELFEIVEALRDISKSLSERERYKYRNLSCVVYEELLKRFRDHSEYDECVREILPYLSSCYRKKSFPQPQKSIELYNAWIKTARDVFSSEFFCSVSAAYCDLSDREYNINMDRAADMFDYALYYYDYAVRLRGGVDKYLENLKTRLFGKEDSSGNNTFKSFVFYKRKELVPDEYDFDRDYYDKKIKEIGNKIEAERELYRIKKENFEKCYTFLNSYPIVFHHMFGKGKVSSVTRKGESDLRVVIDFPNKRATFDYPNFVNHCGTEETRCKRLDNIG